MTALATAAAIATMIAGHPTQVACDATTANGWAYVGGTVVHLRTDLCEALARRPAGPDFAQGLSTLLHEAAHARGVVSEACAEMYAHALIYDTLRRYYNVPFFTATSWSVGWMAHATAPHGDKYAWNSSSCDSEP